jgi:hypothetical protein
MCWGNWVAQSVSWAFCGRVERCVGETGWLSRLVGHFVGESSDVLGGTGWLSRFSDQNRSEMTEKSWFDS